MSDPVSRRKGAAKTSRRSTQSVTLAEVAQLAGVSAQTVSRALRTPDQVREATLATVKKAVEATGYVPNMTARNLASNRSMTVGALVPNLVGTIFTDLLSGLDETLSPNGYHLFVGTTGYDPESEEEMIRAFLGRRPDGMVLTGTSHTRLARQMLSKANIPIIETLTLSGKPIDSLVGFSNSQAIRFLTESRITKGFKHPTFAGWLRDVDERANERLRGFHEAVTTKLPGEPLRFVNTEDLGISIEAGRYLAREVLMRHPETDLLVCSSDVFAQGAILEFVSRGIDIPGRIGVTGLGDFDLAKHLSPSLTTVHTPNKDVGRAAAEILLKAMSSRRKTPSRVVRDLGFNIISRESA
jgi:LacI family gluconate utilization system Gnt-I transcriptional repressor